MADHPYSFGPLALGLVPAKQVDELQNYGDRVVSLTASTKLARFASFDYGIEIVNIIDFLLHR